MPQKAPGQSHRDGISVVELFQMFPDDQSARTWFENIRWPNKERHCPHCGGMETSMVLDENPMPYHCKNCRKYFSVRTGTVMQSSQLSLQKWVIGIYLMSVNLKGFSSMKLHRDLGITQKSAWLLAQKIRQGFKEGTDKLSGTVEVDETYIGGKESNKHGNKKLKVGWGTVGKKAVVGAKQRGGKVVAKPIDGTSRVHLREFVNTNVEMNSKVITDDHAGYTGMSGYEHESICHSVGEYVEGMAHTNGIESFWAMLKRGYHGTFHHMSEKHLHRYVNEFAGRHNIRSRDTLDQMVAIVCGLVGKRLRYQDLVAE